MPRKSPYEFTADDWKILDTQCDLSNDEFDSFPLCDRTSIKTAYANYIELLESEENGSFYCGARTFLQNIVNEIRCKIREQAE